ncbi:MAG: hypothetical protein ABFD86_19010 [Bryobacteraceae bacterium]
MRNMLSTRRGFLATAALPLVAAPERPRIRKLGTIDLDLVETTPIVWKNRLYRCEWVRAGYWANPEHKDYFRFVERATGRATPAFAHGHQFASAFVEGGTVYVTGVEKGGQPMLRMFASRDLLKWDSWTVFNMPGWGIFNTSICKARDHYVLMFEIDKPKEQAGRPFTARFATSKDLRTWELTPPECVYAKDRYTAPHCLRYLDGWYYDFYLEAHEGYEMRVVRSQDLIHWTPSPLNPVLKASDEDRKIANPKLTAGQRRRIATAENCNNSDIDFCEFQGRLWINYSWGNQRGVEHLAEAVYEGSEASFLKGWFPPRAL